MLAVEHEHMPSPMHSSLDNEIEPSLTEPEIAPLKQQSKKKLLTPLNIMIILAALTLIGLGSYYLFSLSVDPDLKSQIKESHGQIISNADSSSQKDGSNTGSSSSKSSTNNNRPNARSQPAQRGPISSNSKLTGAGSPPNGDDEDDRDDSSDKKKSNSGGSSTEIDSEEDTEEEASEEDPNA
jgi:hypothetical protein